MKSSDIPVERSKTLEFVKDTRDVIGSQPKIETMDFADTIDRSPIDIKPAKSFDFNLKDILRNVRDIPDQDIPMWPSFLKDILRNVRDIPDQDIPMWPSLDLTDSSLKQNYVEFQQSYMGILNEVKHEAEQARLLDSDIEKIKNETYDDSDAVMKEIYDVGVSMPEVDWNEDGSINLSWFLKTGGTSTISLYGDDCVIYNAYLDPDNYVRSVCKIRDGLLLPKLIGILSNITE